MLVTVYVHLQLHRVLLPEDESRKRSVRKSIAFFLHPDNDVLIECVDGSNKYPPVLAAENAIKRAKVNYWNTATGVNIAQYGSLHASAYFYTLIEICQRYIERW